MDTKPVTGRMLGLIRHVRHLKPDIICLQELTKLSFSVIQKALCQRNPQASPKSENDPDMYYTMHCHPEWSDTHPYFCAMLTREKLFKGDQSEDSKCIPFIRTNMLRGYVHVYGLLEPSSIKVSLVTSHLESLAQGSECRKEQLGQLLDLQRDMVEDGYCTIFAGDTNLRENEVSARLIQKKALPDKTAVAVNRPSKKTKTLPKFQDAWVVNGEDADNKFTWDMSRNDNLQGFDTFKPKARYDRAFLLAPEGVNMSVPTFKLVGQQRTESSKFISDHWGLFCVLSVLDEQNNKLNE